MVFITPHRYHRGHLCSTTGICVGLFIPVVFSWYYTVSFKYHSTAVWYFCDIIFLCGISCGIFRTTWVPRASPLQYHRNMCGTFLSLWYFLWYFRTTWVPQASPLQYHGNMCGTFLSLWYFLWYFCTTWVPQASSLQYRRNMCGTFLSLWYFLWLFSYHMGTTGFIIAVPQEYVWYICIPVVFSVVFYSMVGDPHIDRVH